MDRSVAYCGIGPHVGGRRLALTVANRSPTAGSVHTSSWAATAWSRGFSLRRWVRTRRRARARSRRGDSSPRRSAAGAGRRTASEHDGARRHQAARDGAAHSLEIRRAQPRDVEVEAAAHLAARGGSAHRVHDEADVHREIGAADEAGDHRPVDAALVDAEAGGLDEVDRELIEAAADVFVDVRDVAAVALAVGEAGPVGGVVSAARRTRAPRGATACSGRSPCCASRTTSPTSRGRLAACR